MSVPKTVEFTGGKILETPDATGVADEVVTLAGTLTSQIECVQLSVRLNPGVVDEIINIGNITTKKLIVIKPTGAITVKFNGISNQPIPFGTGSSVLFATISGLSASNPSLTTPVDVEIYASTDVG